ncbi:MAG: hypothetical protein EAZ08_12885 [Cytophagales bacterium]|nr:MAG: hypothetical protein EAZ08_12885 [Cytophagales bacterium]
MRKITFIFIFLLSSAIAFSQQNNKEYEAGKKSFNAKDYKAAITQFGKVLTKNQENVMARYYRGLSYGEMKFYKEALADMNEAIKFVPNNADFYYQRAMIKRKQGNNELAISDLDNAIILDSKQSNYFFERGNLNVAMKYNSEAAADFAQAQLLNPDNEELKNSFKSAFEKITKEERDELAYSSGLTAAGLGGGKPTATATADDQNTIAEKKYITERKFKTLEEGKQYFFQLKAKQGFAAGKKNILLGLLRKKVLADVYGETPFAEQIEDMKYFVDVETWLSPEGKKYYFDLTNDSKYWFSNGIQRKNTYYFYKAMRYKNSEKYRLQVFAVVNNESNLVMSSEIRIKEDSTTRTITIPHAVNKGYMWATSNTNILETKIDLATNQANFVGLGSLGSSEDKNHGIGQEQYRQLITPTDASIKSSMKAAMNYLVIMYPSLFRP